jgi:putative ABC transport system substrate-binding protein
MQRREFMALVGGAALIGAGAAKAQTPGKTWRLGTLHPAQLMNETNPFAKILLKTLGAQGYVFGQNLTLEARNAAGDMTKIPQLLQELKARDVDAIVVVSYPVALAGKSSGIPLVGALGLGDPVATGLIDSLAHPGGNITGISDVAATLTTKRLSLLKELSPKCRRSRCSGTRTTSA